jgi:hypothetical protein
MHGGIGERCIYLKDMLEDHMYAHGRVVARERRAPYHSEPMQTWLLEREEHRTVQSQCKLGCHHKRESLAQASSTHRDSCCPV